MEKFNLFETLPEGFKKIENDIDHKLVSLTITQAFADYKYPTPTLPISYSSLMKIFHDLAESWIDNAKIYGTVLTNDDYSAVMVLTPIEHTCEIDFHGIGDKLSELENKEAGQNYIDILTYICNDEESLNFRKGTVYIDAFAVQTPRQGQKLGSRLMRKLFEACDEQDRDIFLFTNTERNAAIYEHFGFETIKKSERKDLDSSTWFMLRKPMKK